MLFFLSMMFFLRCVVAESGKVGDNLVFEAALDDNDTVFGRSASSAMGLEGFA